MLDSFGRVKDSNLVNDPDGETTAATSYDSNDRVSQVTYPYRATADGQDTYAYDAVNRVTSISHADSTSSSISYGAVVGGTGVNTTQLCSSATYGLGYPTLATDEAGKKREVWTDGLGRTIEVDEPNSSGSLTENTCYTYDLNNNLTQVVSPTGQTRAFTYDNLSRVLSLATPETRLGGTQYSTSFSYTSGGSPCSGNPSAVCSRTDPRGITTTYTYDAVNRLTKISYSNSTPTVTYCYDGNNTSCISGGYSSSNGIGRRTAMADGSGSTGWSYDATGRIVTEKRTIAGITKTISYSYNEDGSIASITYPSGHVVTYTTSNAERPLSAVDSGSSVNYALTASYAPMGALSSVIYGQATGFNGTTESRAYNNRMEMTSVQASSSNGTAMNLAPCFNPFSFSSGCSSTATNNNGSVTGITNNVDTGESQTFSYDTLNRISSAATKSTSGNDCWGQNFGPDAVANLTSISVTQCTAGSLSVTTDGYNHLSATGYSYDDAGDMTSDGSYTYTYDAENRIMTANGVTYTYDGNGLRVEKSSGTLYWRSITGDVLAESDLQGNITNEYVFFAGRRIAQRTSGGSVYFYYADTLGTVHTITDATGHACYDASFTPYGQEVPNPNIPQTCTSNYKFTGYEYDSETGLYYAKARYYNPRLGRFMSPDPLAGSLPNPQTWNRYAYVMNNAENLTDPLGLWGGGVLCLVAGRRGGIGHYDACGYGPMEGDSGGGGGGGGGSWGGDCGLDGGSVGCGMLGLLEPPEDIGWEGVCLNGNCLNQPGYLQSVGINPTTQPQSPCNSIAGTGGTIPVATSSGEVRLGFNAGGYLVGIGVQLTGGSSAMSAGFSVQPNTFAGAQLAGSSAVTIGFNNAIETPSSWGISGYVQSATFSGGAFTSANGAVAVFGVPLGSTNTPSSLILNQLNGTPAALSTAGGLLSLLQWTSHNITCAGLLGGS